MLLQMESPNSHITPWFVFYATGIVLLLYRPTASAGRRIPSANVVPIFKKGDRLQPNNYRPISLTSITCKMLEHIITSNIMQHLDTHHILHDAQH